ncbi:MAG: peptidoglycan bridge formation glycyltransferase FemA/FemB family protein [Erysipelotrichaceae bacterium]|nr:peptidoglycan bridge formation glycyltransferase FemA/FemB family protein [Erysipelotrichaceae bacterium]
MEFKVLNSEQYKQYYQDFKIRHFMQSYGFSLVYNSRGYVCEYVGVFEDEKPLALAMLARKKILNYTSYYAPRGLLCDYHDKALLDFFMTNLKDYLYKHKALYLKIDPGIVISKRNFDSEIIEEYPEKDILKILEAYGFKHRGFSYDLVDSSQPRFTFRLNIEKDLPELLAGMNSYNRNILKKPFEELQIIKNDPSTFPDFYQTMKDTALRENLMLPDIHYYENFYNNLRLDQGSDLYVAKIDVDLLISNKRNKIEELKNNISELESSASLNNKKKNRIIEYQGSITKLEKEITSLLPYEHQTPTLSGIITAKDDDKVWIVYGGNRDILKDLNVNYHLYYQVLKDAKEEGYKVLDFFGTHGHPDKDNPEYGLFLYKSKFGGDLLEFIGEFDLIIHPLANKILMSLVKLRRRIKQKI